MSFASNDGGVLKYTDISSIPNIVSSLNQSFHTRALDSIDLRIKILTDLYNAIRSHSEELCEALYKDFHRSKFETATHEISPTLAELQHVISNIKKWAKPKSGPYAPALPFLTMGKKLERIPLGVVLIISAFNYPLFLSISPVVGAIAAGNCVVFKPSEITPHFSTVLTKLLESTVSPDYLRVVNGAIPETTSLLEQKFDKILYTGSGRVGKIVSQAAARHLTPVVLELGGKSPAIISKSLSNSELKIAIKRIIWAKFANAGQICVTVDYLLIDEVVYDEAIKCIQETVKEFFSKLDSSSEGYTHIASQRGYDRLVSLMGSTKGDILVGGVTDETKRFIYPTIYTGITWDDSLMEDEIFGPLLPIIKFSDINHTISDIISNHDTPLAAYIFSQDSSEINLMQTRVRSGGLFINDCMIHVGNIAAPFGGIGKSGHGTYHGESSFKTFSHERMVLRNQYWSEKLYESRYPPYKNTNKKLLSFVFLPIEDLETKRNIKYGLIGLMFLLVSIATNMANSWVREGNLPFGQ
ncbi:hexadecenal dehydrogenase [Saccharomycopsis crataegensis]|uniref:Aldehyde dehydrogenase n=1 Tax=Saccharomycopsis crataegensis TaxID=43959 RepID=A0AAV5QV61_9ASCO|nr:hexadecenal dehydrogenase [Saccharomycopsis crataegensis]